MHVVFDASAATPHFPGIGRYVRELAGALPPLLRDGEHLSLLFPDGVAAPVLESGAAQVRMVRVPPHVFSARAHFRVRKLIASLAPDVVHAPYVTCPPPSRGRFVLTLHDAIPVTHPRLSTWRARLYWRLAAPRVIRRADVLVAVTHAAGDALRNAWPSLKLPPVKAVHHGVNAAFRASTGEAVRRLRERYALPERFLLCLGSDRPHKNTALLLDVQARLCGRAPLLVVAGLQSGAGAARLQARRLGLDASRVRWLEEVPESDMPALYGAAAALLFPSRVEGFGLPVLEALCCGTPVIASDLPALREVGGDLPRWLPADDADAWAEAVLAVDGRRLAENELSGIRRRFTWQRAAQETLEVYRAVAAC
ncbi:MAG: glycosyltransferase family 1 protein [Kiritimatiellae bacterium]|nr:glycosyltransferase family 1 protein [Kiritimatiellia bacterium]